MEPNMKTMVIWVMAFVLGYCGTVKAQGPRYSNAPQVPFVPDLEPRSPQGPDPQQQWRIRRREDERRPVAEFLDSIKGVNDAAIEVVLNRSKILTTKAPISNENGVAVIAVSDPLVVEFVVLPDSRMIRLTGGRVGTTDLTFVTADGETFSFAIHVVYDLDVLRAHLLQMFPSAHIRLGQLRDHVVVEGQARSTAQIEQILNTVRLFLASASQPRARPTGSSGQLNPPRGRGQGGGSAEGESEEPPPEGGQPGQPLDQPSNDGERDDAGVAYEEGQRPTIVPTRVVVPEIINLLKLPGPRQVMLKVQIAELNRTALRQIGADMFGEPGNNALLSFGQGSATGTVAGGTLTDVLFAGGAGTVVGVFDSSNFSLVLRALRQNNIATILAEPTLITLDGHQAKFQAGGEFPVPVAQQGGGAGNTTVEFKKFGVQLSFIPYILDDGVIRLYVEPEVSNVADELAVTLIAGGNPIPGLRTRNASTTVELREGQTLAIAGLLNREVDGSASRIPFLGDLPYIGALFSGSKHQVVEQELIVAVTPYLVAAVDSESVPPLPGQEIHEPNDWEFYLLQRIEGRLGRPHRSTTQWDNPFNISSQIQLEQHFFSGPIGLSQ